MEELFLFMLTFLFVYAFYYLFLIRKENKVNNIVNSVEFRYLQKVYKLKAKELNLKKVANLIALANALIFSLVLSTMSYGENFYLKIGIAILVLVPIILVVYHVVGKYLKRSVKNV